MHVPDRRPARRGRRLGLRPRDYSQRKTCLPAPADDGPQRGRQVHACPHRPRRSGRYWATSARIALGWRLVEGAAAQIKSICDCPDRRILEEVRRSRRLRGLDRKANDHPSAPRPLDHRPPYVSVALHTPERLGLDLAVRKHPVPRLHRVQITARTRPVLDSDRRRELQLVS